MVKRSAQLRGRRVLIYGHLRIKPPPRIPRTVLGFFSSVVWFVFVSAKFTFTTSLSLLAKLNAYLLAIACLAWLLAHGLGGLVLHLHLDVVLGRHCDGCSCRFRHRVSLFVYLVCICSCVRNIEDTVRDIVSRFAQSTTSFPADRWIEAPREATSCNQPISLRLLLSLRASYTNGRLLNEHASVRNRIRFSLSLVISRRSARLSAAPFSCLTMLPVDTRYL